MSGMDLSYVNFMYCTGFTGTQLAETKDITGIRISAEQYDILKSDLPSNIYIYVNNKLTLIP